MCSTGKRRYGHPALTGVLPQPWLPLKKGETLVNRPHENGFKRRKVKGEDDTLVLSLRRKSSNLRRRSRNPLSFGAQSPQQPPRHSQSFPQPSGSTSDTFDLSNPWARSNNSLAGSSGPDEPSASRGNHHRLSFDPASGVMVLPDADDWLDESDEEEDDDAYSTPTPNSPVRGAPTLENETVPSPTRGELSPVARGGDTPDSTPRRRHGTYFHHPERRISRIGLGMPGEFRDLNA